MSEEYRHTSLPVRSGGLALLGQRVPNEQALSTSLGRYDNIARNATYAHLAKRPEFQGTHELLREFTGAVAASQADRVISLPPPPATE